MVDKRLLELKLKAKRRKPRFARKDAHLKPRIEIDVWRKPRGSDNKQRQKFKGIRRWPSSGYRSPQPVKGVGASGLLPVLVSSPKQLVSLTKENGIIIASSVGDRKRQLILQEAKKSQLTVLNLDADKAIEQISARLKNRKEDRQKQLEEQKAEEEKQKKKEEKEKKAAAAKAEEKPAEPELSEEEKQKKEKEEKDKVLTHK